MGFSADADMRFSAGMFRKEMRGHGRCYRSLSSGSVEKSRYIDPRLFSDDSELAHCCQPTRLPR